ncbi:uncharacterized protein YdeI (YjbR/CyaY-like superfamily) [Catalinimonas alkaloidigena]|uniref:YdeI/OmpD-associated family protein n=1 Tax=Catalinimonas alkaloidigena TaxID=1075417 RepID=UPI00240673E0|nr:DUF1801 domain-containing protein [Catalinimonas alkaloidigena]MDF9797728.1 uncharacterized protein YdeI (YjbR/CyaY-like superfamily) [Catalinimonas alkaloidigena]
MESDKRVEAYIDRHQDKKEMLLMLRDLLLDSELQETIKWGIPCYTWDGKNVIGMAAFKAYAALWFYQGALLTDKHNVLINAQEGKTQALRQWRFTSSAEVDSQTVKVYIQEAVKHQKEGKVVNLRKPKVIAVPPILKSKLNDDQTLAKAFHALSAAKQREYSEYIMQAKRENTRIKRLEKVIPMILEGRGLNDRYKKV